MFKSVNLNLCALGCAKKICSLFSCAMGTSIIRREEATLKVAEKLHLTPHELKHRHESRLLGCTKPANQLVAYIGETGNSLKVIPDTFVEFAFVRSALFGHRFTIMLFHSVRPMS